MIAGRRFAMPVDAKAPLAPASRYTVVGSSPARPDIPAKCTGRYTYIQDFSVPGMLHARVIRPPAIGARLVSTDESSIRSIPGARVIRIESFLAVAAPNEWAAVRASRELKAVWTDWEGLPGHDNLEPYLRAGAVERDQTFVNRGSKGELEAGELDAALTAGTKQFAATYFWPCQSHASLGPSAAVADVRDDAVTIWTSSQATYGMRATLARVFGLTPEKVRVIFVEGLGSGRRERSGSCGGRRAPHLEDD